MFGCSRNVAHASEQGIIACGISSLALLSRRRMEGRETVEVLAKESLAGTAYGEVGRVGLADFIAVDTSLESGEGRLGQFVHDLPEQTVLLRAEQKAWPAGSSAQAKHVFGSPEHGNLEPTLINFRLSATPAAAAGCRCPPEVAVGCSSFIVAVCVC